ncbi:MAG TPA: hypothetical protein DD490_06115 [Acidobacteria bacterium]|nr:hypothetical protein [Acidobacteriota bacterium]
MRRGLYGLAPPFRRVLPHPFLVANLLVRGSYVSLQAALAQYGLIPEYVPVTTSVTPGRPGHWDTPLGSYLYRQLGKDLQTGFRRTLLAGGQEALVAGKLALSVAPVSARRVWRVRRPKAQCGKGF